MPQIKVGRLGSFLRPFLQPITRHNAGQAREMASQYLTQKKVPHKINIGMSVPKTNNHGLAKYRGGDAVTVPTAQGPHRIFSSSTSPSVMMHEAGHAQNMHNISNVIGRRGMVGAYRAANDYLPTIGNISGPTIGVMVDKDSTLGRNAWMIPLGMAAPQLTEEAVASARGMAGHRRMQGSRAALRGIPGSLAGLGAYAKWPLVSALATYFANQVK